MRLKLTWKNGILATLLDDIPQQSVTVSPAIRQSGDAELNLSRDVNGEAASLRLHSNDWEVEYVIPPAMESLVTGFFG